VPAASSETVSEVVRRLQHDRCGPMESAAEAAVASATSARFVRPTAAAMMAVEVAVGHFLLWYGDRFKPIEGSECALRSVRMQLVRDGLVDELGKRKWSMQCDGHCG
jgi:hypothetical protein